MPHRGQHRGELDEPGLSEGRRRLLRPAVRAAHALAEVRHDNAAAWGDLDVLDPVADRAVALEETVGSVDRGSPFGHPVLAQPTTARNGEQPSAWHRLHDRERQIQVLDDHCGPWRRSVPCCDCAVRPRGTAAGDDGAVLELFCGTRRGDVAVGGPQSHEGQIRSEPGGQQVESRLRWPQHPAPSQRLHGPGEEPRPRGLYPSAAAVLSFSSEQTEHGGPV